MYPYVTWNSVEPDRWTYSTRPRQSQYVVYALTQLPDFTDTRFLYLCKETDNRKTEVIKRQQSMIRQFHSLGENWGISMRLIKEGGDIKLYLIFRCSSAGPMDDSRMGNALTIIDNALMKNEYTFQRITDPAKIASVLRAGWAGEISEIIKQETEYKGDALIRSGEIKYQQEFYVPYTWSAVDNNMEAACSALMRHSGNASLEITILPTNLLDREKNWLGKNAERLKECMNGEKLRHESGKLIWEGKKLPALKTPLENCEKVLKQYETSRLFLTTVRVCAERGAAPLASAYMNNSVRNAGTIYTFPRGTQAFRHLMEGYENVDIAYRLVTSYWDRHRNDAPYSAQRLNRLNSLEEVSNFFRIPVPIKPGFPGFAFDTGMGAVGAQRKKRSTIRLGSYLDEERTDRQSAEFDSQQLAKHGLIVGVPGSGKTTAMFNILHQLWAVPQEQKIPFIILEPAKTEYRALKSLPAFRDDLLVFTLGDESVSPFRFNPLEVLPGIKIESHISKLQACFIGAFDLFDPLPIFLEQAIRRTYEEKGWYDDSVGGDPGLETPTLSDLRRNAQWVVENSGFDSKMRGNFQASLLERLNSLCRGSKGRMLNTPRSIPMEELMERPVVLELDSLNSDEKSLMMMFLLTYVFEYCKVQRKSGSVLKHMLLVEEAHNLISAQGGGSENRANPKAKTIELFVNMLAEMRALGEGILIADQLPTAIAPQAVKQTNVKILMRVTAKDDREEIGNTMDLNEDQMHQVVNFKTGHAYLYHEGEDRVRSIRMLNFKGEHHVEEPQTDAELKAIMADYERTHLDLYRPYPQCAGNCTTCDRRVRNQAEAFAEKLLGRNVDLYKLKFKDQPEKFRNMVPLCGVVRLMTLKESDRLLQRYKHLGKCFGGCVWVHVMNNAHHQIGKCVLYKKYGTCDNPECQDILKRFNQK